VTMIKHTLTEGFDLDVDALVAVLTEPVTEDPLGKALDAALDGLVSRLAAQDNFRGRQWEVYSVEPPRNLRPSRLILTGVGRDETDYTRFNRAASCAGRVVLQTNSRTVALIQDGPAAAALTVDRAAQAAVEGLLAGSYFYGAHKRSAPEPPRAITVAARPGVDEDLLQKGVTRGRILGRARRLTRDLVNCPGNHLAPADMAAAARKVAAEGGLTCQVIDGGALVEQGFRMVQAVGGGSDRPPCVIRLNYRPDGAGDELPLLVLVGKGLTFDSGGLSLKPVTNLHEMSQDMAGGAAVIGAMQAISELRPNLRVTGIVPAADNIPSGGSYRPGDVLTAFDGTTVEIRNTDAEGRLLLADGVAYAATLDPDWIVDIATLTGACMVALGPFAAGLVHNDPGLSDRVLTAAAAGGEHVWELPNYPEYRRDLRSLVADLRNVGEREGGAIKAGLFIGEFASRRAWAHIDIAPVARVRERHPWLGRGATGLGVLTLACLPEQVSKNGGREA